MAVEARHLCLFPPQINLGNREMVNGIDGGNIMYGEPLGYGVVSGMTTTKAVTMIFPPPTMTYGRTIAADSIPVKTPMKSDSGLTYSMPAGVVSRKRPREDAAAGIFNHHHQFLSFPANNNSSSNRCGSVTFLGEDISAQVHQHQLEVDQLIAHQTAKVRREIEEQRKSYSRRIIRAVEESMMKKLRAKEEEIENIGKLNWALEEKVRSLCLENQIWRELAQSNEATANALRNNLEQVLAQAPQVQHHHRQSQSNKDEEGLMDDAQSCCGSNYLVVEEEEVDHSNDIDACGTSNTTNKKNGMTKTSSSSRICTRGLRLCRNCGKDVASVLLLPCRHLCLCYACGITLHSCPICLSTKNATLHINSSSSSS